MRKATTGAELGTTWPSLRKAFTRHGLGMPTRNPEAVHQRAVAAARHRNGQPAPPATPPLDPMFVALNRGQPPPPRGLQPEQGVRLRRGEEIETLSYRTVVALNQDSRLAPRWRIATIARRAERAQRLAGDRPRRAERRHAKRVARTGRSSRPTPGPRSGGCSPMPASPTEPQFAEGSAKAHCSSLSARSAPKA
jgi:hypothetical protein